MRDDAERLLEVIGDRVVVEFADATFLGADDPGKVSEMIDGERKIGIQRLADGFPVLPRLRVSEHLKILFHTIGNLIQDDGTFRHRRLAPIFFCGVSRV